METKLRRARVPDVEAMQRLINSFADRDEMLPRSLNELYENVRDFFVLENEEGLAGCCALHVNWGDLAEIKCLAVKQGERGKGFGRKLVEACLEDAREIGLSRVFALTYIPDYFERLGFRRVEKAELPQKVWSECIRCPKFPDCGEISMILDLS
ncbi:MAG: N-acetyltransferase [Armatimonadota bacterium]